ncbi:MAG: SH3 domain-containing protein [Anaerolineae bacterium]|nr:SH3 domain-containing protein [Anaerolineae bacterium]
MRHLTILWLTFSSLAAPLYAQDSGLTATAYQTVNVRSGPSTQYEIIGQITEGDTVPVLGRDSESTRWLYIALRDNEDTEGWVAVFTVTLSGNPNSLEVIEPVPDDDSLETVPVDGVRIVAFGRVNVRSGPGITYDIVDQLEIEEQAEATARSNYNNDWLYIENTHLSGWVAYFTVTVRGNADELPVLVPDAASSDLVPPSALIRTSFNVRLHSRPAFAAGVTGELSFGTQVTPLGVTRDGRWLYVATDEVEGWGWTRLFAITGEQLAQIPRRSVTTTPTPSPTPFSPTG